MREGESLEDRPRSGRPRTLTSTLHRRLGQIKHPRASAAVFARDLTLRSDRNVSDRTARRALHDIDYHFGVPGRKKLTPIQKSARVAFARAHLHDVWDTTWSFDQAYFNLYRTKNKCWRKVSTEEATDYRRLTRAQERISLGIAVAISRGRNQR